MQTNAKKRAAKSCLVTENTKVPIKQFLEEIRGIMSESYESRNNPISGLLFGIFLFFVSIYTFWLNENRFDYGKAAAKTYPIRTFKQDKLKKLENKNVSLTNKIKTKHKLADPIFFAKGEKFFTLSRKVEVYAWVEKRRDNRTYYEQEWTSKPELIRGNKNPKWPYYYSQIRSFRLGKMTINTDKIEFFYDTRLLKDNTVFTSYWQGKLRNSDSYFYPLHQSIGNPKHNDHRIKFEVHDPIARGTLFGKLRNATIVPYFGPKKNSGGLFKNLLKALIQDKDTLFHLSKLNRKAAIKLLRKDFATTKMIARLVTWLLLAVGISLLFSPLTYFTDFIPIVGRALQTMIFVLSLAASTLICFVIYITAFIFSSPWITVGVMCMIGMLIYRRLYKQKQKDILKFSSAIKNEMTKTAPQHASLLQAQDQSWTKQDCILFLRIAGKLVAVDKKVDPGEINFLRNFAQAHKLGVEEANKIVQEGADSAHYDIDSIRPEIAVNLIQALSDLCLADGYLNDAEYRLMLDICKKTKLSKRKLHRILDGEMSKLMKIYRSQRVQAAV